MKCEKYSSNIGSFHLFKKTVTCPHCGHINKRNYTHSEKRIVARIVATIFVAVVLAFGAFNQFMTRFETKYGQYRFDNCESIMKYDDDTIANSKDIYDQINQYFSNNDFEHTSQEVIYYLKDALSTEMNIYANKDDMSYTLYLNYEHGECTLKELSFTGSYEGNLGESLKYLNHKEFDYLCSLMGYPDISDRFNDIYSKLKPHSENPGLKNITVKENDYDLYIKEDAGEDYNHVLFEYRISNY